MENRSLVKAAGVSLFDLKLKKNNFCYAGKNTREDWLQGEVWEGNLISRDLSVWHLYLELTFFHNLNIPKDLTNNTFVESISSDNILNLLSFCYHFSQKKLEFSYLVRLSFFPNSKIHMYTYFERVLWCLTCSCSRLKIAETQLGTYKLSHSTSFKHVLELQKLMCANVGK